MSLLKHHRNAEPCRTGIWGWHIANTSKYLTKCGICYQPYISTFITLSRKKGGKRLYTSSFWGISDVRKSLFSPTPLFSCGNSVLLTLSTQVCRDSLSPFPGTAARGAYWGWGYYLGDCKVPLQRSITCQNAFKHFIQIRNKRDHPPLHKSQTAFKWGSCPSGLTETNCKWCCYLCSWEVQCKTS